MQFPDRKADSAIYIMSRHIPIEGEIHKCMLGRLGNILRCVSTEQILVKDGRCKSWFVYVNKMLNQYDLPSSIFVMHLTLKSSGNSFEIGQ